MLSFIQLIIFNILSSACTGNSRLTCETGCTWVDDFVKCINATTECAGPRCSFCFTRSACTSVANESNKCQWLNETCTSCISGCSGCLSSIDCKNAGTSCSQETVSNTENINCYDGVTECGISCPSCLKEETCQARSDCVWNETETPPCESIFIPIVCNYSSCDVAHGCREEYENSDYVGCFNPEIECGSKCSTCEKESTCWVEGCDVEKDSESTFIGCYDAQTECGSECSSCKFNFTCLSKNGCEVDYDSDLTYEGCYNPLDGCGTECSTCPNEPTCLSKQRCEVDRYANFSYKSCYNPLFC